MPQLHKHFNVSGNPFEMRLSGTYIERLGINILPYTFIVSLLFYLTKKTLFNNVLVSFIVLTLLLWIVDTLVMKTRRPKALKIDGCIILGRQKIKASDISQIRPITYKPGRYWTWKFIEFTVKNDNSYETINVMQKPMTIIETFQGRVSKTLSKLLNKYPELEGKVVGKHLIHSFH